MIKIVRFLIGLAALVLPAAALAQTPTVPSSAGPFYAPNWYLGYTPTALQWQYLLSNKIDNFSGGLPLQYGGTGGTSLAALQALLASSPSTGTFLSLGVTGGATVGTTLGVSGNATIGGALGVTGAATVGGGLTIGPATSWEPLAVTDWYQTQSGTMTPTLSIHGTALGSVSSGQAFYNEIAADADTLDPTVPGGPGGALLLYVGHNLSAGAKGGRTTFQAKFSQVGITNAVSNSNYYVASSGFSSASYSAGGTVGAPLGNLFGTNNAALLQTGAGFYWNSVFCEEDDINIQAGSAAMYKGGFKVVQTYTDAVRGIVADYAYGISNQANGTAPGWTVGLAFGAPEGWWPIQPSGTLIGTYASTLPGGPSMTAAIGIDFSALTLTTFLKGPSDLFDVSGAGAVKAASYTVGATAGVASKTCTISALGATITITGGIVTATSGC
jgi:hypothetical protein